MNKYNTKRRESSRLELVAENAQLYEEVLVAHRASEITAKLVVEQFVKLDEFLKHIEEKAATEKELRQRLAEELREAEIRERELAEARAAAEAANQAKSAFLANMSHELRTPLNAVIGYSEMLIEEAEDVGRQDFTFDLQRILDAGKHLMTLINEVLDLSKIEAGKMELFLETFDVSDTVRDVVNTIQPLVDKNANTLDVHGSDRLGSMHSDRTKLRQALFNLLSNACKFTNEGTISLNVTRETLDGADGLVFTVGDTGIGMTAEQMDRLFQAFSQADASMWGKYGGTGLGLVISKRFCQMMGGNITVESVYGRGTTFTIRLPAFLHEPGAERTMEAEPRIETLTDAVKTVLVIDDDAVVRDLMKRFLGKERFRVETASGGKEGLLLAKERHPDAVILDVMMPGMDGWTVLKELKSDPELARIPVIMLTIVDDKNKGYLLGASGYMTKPIDRQRLVGVLHKLIPNPSRILVVDDDPAFRKRLRGMLEKEAWEVVEAENGRAALASLVESLPALILLDLAMPEMDGFQVVEVLRKHPLWSSIPVAIIAAGELGTVDRKRLEGSVNKILRKQGDGFETLLGEVRDLLAAAGR